MHPFNAFPSSIRLISTSTRDLSGQISFLRTRRNWFQSAHCSSFSKRNIEMEEKQDGVLLEFWTFQWGLIGRLKDIDKNTAITWSIFSRYLLASLVSRHLFFPFYRFPDQILSFCGWESWGISLSLSLSLFVIIDCSTDRHRSSIDRSADLSLSFDQLISEMRVSPARCDERSKMEEGEVGKRNERRNYSGKLISERLALRGDSGGRWSIDRSINRPANHFPVRVTR